MKAIVLLLVYEAVGQTSKDQGGGSSCVYDYHCKSRCCKESFGKKDVLGWYCQEEKFCESSQVQAGGSCGKSGQCYSQCCDQSVCMPNSVCFNSYVLPMVIVIALILTFIVIGLAIYIVYKRKTRRAKLQHKLQMGALNKLARQLGAEQAIT